MITARNIALSIAFALSIAMAFGLTNDEALDSFKVANEHYQKSEFEQAFNIYNSLLENGYESSDLYFNMGNTYYKLEEYALSIWSYEKALLIEPNFEDAKINLELANLTLSDKVQELPRIAWWYYWQKFKGLFGVAGWTYLSVIFFWVLAFGLFLFLTKKKHSIKRLGVYFIVMGLLFAFFFGAIAWNKSYALNNPKAAIITTSNVYVKSAPEAESADLFVIHSGLKVKLEDQIGEWLKVKLADGKMGWVQESELKRL